MVLDALLGGLPADRPVTGVQVGIHWTIVGLAEGPGGEPAHWGIAKTLLPVEGPGHSHEHEEGSVIEAGRLHTYSAHELIGLIRDGSGPERSIGWAALNALYAPDRSRCVELNARDFLLEHGRGKRIAVIGHFPFVEKLRGAAQDVWVLELNPAPGDLPASAAEDVLPQADIVAVTSLTLLNDTFEPLAKLWRPDATVLLLGPSTPFAPVLFEMGVDYLSGTEIVDPEVASRHVGQGACFKQMEGVQLLTMAKDGAPA